MIKWPFNDFPRMFKAGKKRNAAVYVLQKTNMTIRYPDVVAQYRESCWIASGHIYVYRDGTFAVDHIDAFNPNSIVLAPLHFLFDLIPEIPEIVRHKRCKKNKDCRENS